MAADILTQLQDAIAPFRNHADYLKIRVGQSKVSSVSKALAATF